MRPYFEALEEYYKTPFRVRTDEEMAEEFLEAGVGAMILAWDAGFCPHRHFRYHSRPSGCSAAW